MIISPCGNDLAFNLFVMEEEGLLETRRGLLNRVIRAIKENNIPENEWYSLGLNCGIDISTLNLKENKYFRERLVV